MKLDQKNIIDLAIVGSGLSSLNFIDTYLSKKRKIHVISPNFSNNLDFSKKNNLHYLPSQMKDKEIIVNNFFFSNKIKLDKSCNALGALVSGGLSNYWGLQLDNRLYKDQKHLKKISKSLKMNLSNFLKNFNY